MQMTPETHFAQNGSVNIAYQVFGEGPRDLIVIPGWLSNLDIFWEEPMAARFFLALSRFSHRQTRHGPFRSRIPPDARRAD